MKVAILTSGGDAPGMNFCIETLIDQCLRNNLTPYVVYKGFQGLIDGNFELAKLEKFTNISHIGGSFIKSYRSNDFLTEKGFQKAIDNCKLYKINCLVIIGGNGSLLGAMKLKNHGINVIFLPGTIDNDLFYTEKSLGFDTAVNSAVDAIDKIKHTIYSVDRGAIVEVMGRECGDLALNSSLAVKADYVISKDVSYNYQELLNKLKNKLNTTPLIIVQENCINIYELAQKLQNETDIEFRANVLGYIQRGGAPSIFDRIFAFQLAVLSINLIKNKQFNLTLGIRDSNIIKEDLRLSSLAKKPDKSKFYTFINN